MKKIITISTLLILLCFGLSAQTRVKDKKARQHATAIASTTAAILQLSSKEESDVRESVASLLAENALIVLERQQMEKWEKIISECSSIISDLNMVFDIYENYDKAFDYLGEAKDIIVGTKNWALLAEKDKLDSGFEIIFDEIDANTDLLLLVLNQKLVSGNNTKIHTKPNTRLLLITEVHKSSVNTLKKTRTLQLICKNLDASTFDSITLEKLIQ